jgi:hypothetical protein
MNTTSYNYAGTFFLWSCKILTPTKLYSQHVDNKSTQCFICNEIKISMQMGIYCLTQFSFLSITQFFSRMAPQTQNLLFYFSLGYNGVRVGNKRDHIPLHSAAIYTIHQWTFLFMAGLTSNIYSMVQKPKKKKGDFPNFWIMFFIYNILPAM